MIALLVWAALLAQPDACFEIGAWLAGCAPHVLRLSSCEQGVLRLCDAPGAVR